MPRSGKPRLFFAEITNHLSVSIAIPHVLYNTPKNHSRVSEIFNEEQSKEFISIINLRYFSHITAYLEKGRKMNVLAVNYHHARYRKR